MGRITEQLKNARLFRGMKATELADKTGMNKGSISQIETGKANPTADTIERICDALQCDIVIYPRMKN